MRRAYVARRCAAGQPIDFRELPDSGHVDVMRAAGPLMGALAWSAFGNYTPVLWGLAAIMLLAAAGFAAAAFLAKREGTPPV